MNHEQIQALALVVDEAAQTATSISMLTASVPELDLEGAYDVQRASMALRSARGERVIGMKMGLTSVAKMKQMGVHNPIYGHLTDAMRVNDGAAIIKSEHCHPRVEPEIAFVLARELRGPVTAQQALEAVGGVYAALEIIDSRYRDFKFTLIDVVADNASSARFVIGNTSRAVDAVELGNLGMVMEINGQVREVGSSAAILEHPARSLAELANMLAERDEYLQAGQVVLAGAATAAVAVEVGDHVRLLIDTLGTVEFTVA
ncbi:MAG: fumarylacetoacetate hydrolase family protein [Bradymonadaceae bacterium]|nr:fumarylacetoacetate hydrolase family protein [Lujinxingiaceae bacterium]